MNNGWLYTSILIFILLLECEARFFLNNVGYCQQQMSVKYQQPIVKTRPHVANFADLNNETYVEQYVGFEEQVRWQTVRICCAGYRNGFFGICQPICNESCPFNSFCAAPNKCLCKHGYEPTHKHLIKHQQLSCHPTCIGGCPRHSHCVGYNHCACRTGYKDVSHVFAPLRCERNKNIFKKK